MKTTTEHTAHSTDIETLYEVVTNKIIGMIENGVAPWRKTWSGYGLARNNVTGHIYTGINYILMNHTKHPIPYFLTFNQVKELGGKIKKGTEAEMVIYFKGYYKDSNDNSLTRDEAKARSLKGEEIKVLRFIKYYNVINVEDIEGVQLDLGKYIAVKLSNNEKIERCEANIPKHA